MIHNLFQNGTATLLGTLEAFLEMEKRGEIMLEEFEEEVGNKWNKLNAKHVNSFL